MAPTSGAQLRLLLYPPQSLRLRSSQTNAYPFTQITAKCSRHPRTSLSLLTLWRAASTCGTRCGSPSSLRPPPATATSVPPFLSPPIFFFNIFLSSRSCSFDCLRPRLSALKLPLPVPQTHLGRLAAVLCMVTGPMLVSLMTAALSRTMALNARENRSLTFPPQSSCRSRTLAVSTKH
jgi:hypothetical protein